MSEYDWDNYYGNEWQPEELNINPHKCYHEWYPILLITTTVYNCKKCGEKKEDTEQK